MECRKNWHIWSSFGARLKRAFVGRKRIPIIVVWPVMKIEEHFWYYHSMSLLCANRQRILQLTNLPVVNSFDRYEINQQFCSNFISLYIRKTFSPLSVMPLYELVVLWLMFILHSVMFSFISFSWMTLLTVFTAGCIVYFYGTWWRLDWNDFRRVCTMLNINLLITDVYASKQYFDDDTRWRFLFMWCLHCIFMLWLVCSMTVNFCHRLLRYW